ncbi:MAG: BON domain-containing protein [Verrucomicrobiia bacterium]
MKAFLIGWLVGALVGGLGVWYFLEGREKPAIRHAQDATAAAIERAADAVNVRLFAWHLTGDDIKNDLARTGKVVRRSVRDAGVAIADATADARVTAKIKAKLVADRELSARNISVNTTDGHVTLAGMVSSPELIGKAMLLALETDGVRDVTSNLQVKAK